MIEGRRAMHVGVRLCGGVRGSTAWTKSACEKLPRMAFYICLMKMQ